MLRDGGTYVEMASSPMRFDRDVMASHLHQGPHVLARGLHRQRLRSASTCSIARATNIPGSRCRHVSVFRGGIGRAVADAMAMKTVKSTIMPWPELAE